VLTEGQLTAATSGKQPARRSQKGSRQKLLSYTDLSVGDLVVHAAHGVGRFDGIRKMPVDGVEKDYILISYAGGDSLYVPATGLDQVSKYIGGTGLGGVFATLFRRDSGREASLLLSFAAGVMVSVSCFGL